MTSDDNASISVPAIGLRRALIALVAVAAAAGLWLSGPIYEDPAYHDFADQRALLGVPNAMDVLSNALFLVTGLAGLLVITRHGRRGCTQRWERAAWLTLFAGVTLTGVGSAWYHVAPNNTSLFWDRLPMTIVFA